MSKLSSQRKQIDKRDEGKELQPDIIRINYFLPELFAKLSVRHVDLGLAIASVIYRLAIDFPVYWTTVILVSYPAAS